MNNHSNDHIISTEPVIKVQNSKISETRLWKNPYIMKWHWMIGKSALYMRINGILDFDEINVMEYDEQVSVNEHLEIIQITIDWMKRNYNKCMINANKKDY